MKLFTALTLLTIPLVFAKTTDAGDQRVRRMKASKSTKSSKSAPSMKIRVPNSPPLPGMSNMNAAGMPKVVLAQDTNYPPYTSIGEDLDISGFGPDFARGLDEVCDVDIVLVQTEWASCWGSNKIGSGLSNGEYHGCTTYTNTKGVRNRYLEFSEPILAMNKAAGILTRLEGGAPVVDGQSSLSGVNVGDVVGWAPTEDVLITSTNLCSGETFSGFTIVPNAGTSGI